jgi:hypothetical protein
MSSESKVRFADQFAVKSLVGAAGFISCREQNGLTLQIKSEGDAPLAIRCAEAKLLHVRMTGVGERIDAGPPPAVVRIAEAGTPAQASPSVQLSAAR